MEKSYCFVSSGNKITFGTLVNVTKYIKLIIMLKTNENTKNPCLYPKYVIIAPTNNAANAPINCPV